MNGYSFANFSRKKVRATVLFELAQEENKIIPLGGEGVIRRRYRISLRCEILKRENYTKKGKKENLLFKLSL